MPRVLPHSIGCVASPSVPAETVVADGWSAFLLFFAVSERVNSATGCLDDLGVAIVEFTECTCLRLGYPNDEGLPEHPLYEQGLSDLAFTVGEVHDSTWIRDVGAQMHASAERIWATRGIRPAARALRHFVVPLKEMTVECLASDVTLVKFVESFEEAHAYVHARQAEH